MHLKKKEILPNKWLNADFITTGSYSSKLDEVSVYPQVSKYYEKSIKNEVGSSAGR